eukprot:RCo026940
MKRLLWRTPRFCGYRRGFRSPADGVAVSQPLFRHLPRGPGRPPGSLRRQSTISGSCDALILHPTASDAEGKGGNVSSPFPADSPLGVLHRLALQGEAGAFAGALTRFWEHCNTHAGRASHRTFATGLIQVFAELPPEEGYNVHIYNALLEFSLGVLESALPARSSWAEQRGDLPWHSLGVPQEPLPACPGIGWPKVLAPTPVADPSKSEDKAAPPPGVVLASLLVEMVCHQLLISAGSGGQTSLPSRGNA